MAGGMFGLDGRTALITGAAGGIGTAVITAFANAGASLVITDMSDECVTQAKMLTEWGVPSNGIPADLSKPEDVKRLAKRALAMRQPRGPRSEAREWSRPGRGRGVTDAPHVRR